MFCSREETTYHLILQQNEKSPQNIYNTLAHRAEIVSHNQEELNKELEHIKRQSRPVNSPFGLKTTTTQI